MVDPSFLKHNHRLLSTLLMAQPEGILEPTNAAVVQLGSPVAAFEA
jgi:hypothetical protein